LWIRIIFVYSAGTLAGVLSFLPGGLVATEGSMSALLQRLTPLAAGPAVAATLPLRASTLWFGVGLGLMSVTWLELTRLSTRSERTDRQAYLTRPSARNQTRVCSR